MEQKTATERMLEKCTQLLDYLADHADVKIRFRASDMTINIHLDVSYLLEAKACSRTCGHFSMGWMPKDDESIQLNGAFYVDANIMRFVVALAAEAKLGALYHNFQKGIVYRKILSDMGHPKPKTPLHWDNATTVGIANNTVKRQHSCSMDMILLGK